MATETNIAWCDHTFNPWRGCAKVSPGCGHCYADALSKINPAVLGVWGDRGTRPVAVEDRWKEPAKWDRLARRAGERRRVFCASMADVFEDRPELAAPRDRLFRLIDSTRGLDWLLLTKHAENIARMLPAGPPARNVWLGVSVEDRRHGLPRIDVLRQAPAALRFLSCEPLLEDLGALDLAGIAWVIVGGESGPRRREMDLAWLQSIVRQCGAAGVPCFVKQDNGRGPGEQGRIPDDLWAIKQFPAQRPREAGRAGGEQECEW
jgi:protein gp37